MERLRILSSHISAPIGKGLLLPQTFHDLLLQATDAERVRLKAFENSTSKLWAFLNTTCNSVLTKIFWWWFETRNLARNKLMAWSSRAKETNLVSTVCRRGCNIENEFHRRTGETMCEDDLLLPTLSCMWILQSCPYFHFDMREVHSKTWKTNQVWTAKLTGHKCLQIAAAMSYGKDLNKTQLWNFHVWLQSATQCQG